MQSNSDYTAQQYRKYNGQMVFRALRAIGNEVSAEDLANHISQHIGEREEKILPEIKEVLRRGIVNGFLVRNGTNYSLVGEDDNVQIDYASRRKRPSSSGLIVDSNKRHKTSNAIFASKEIPNVQEDDYSDYSDEEEEESDDNQAVGWKTIRPIVKLYEMFSPEAISEKHDEEESYSEVEEPHTPRPLLTFKNINQK